MTSETGFWSGRRILLVTHTGRQSATESGPASHQAATGRGHRRPCPSTRRPRARRLWRPSRGMAQHRSSSPWWWAATAPSCEALSWRELRAPRCSGSTSGGSGFSPKPSSTTSTGSPNTSSTVVTPSSLGSPSRPTLSLMVCVAHRLWALNEIAVEKASPARMIEVGVEVDRRRLSRWGCDGVVCATPTGSTAYAFSAGGPVVWPDVDALLLVPLSAHALFARPLVIAPSSVINIDVLAMSAAAVLSADGRRSVELPPGAQVSVRRSPQAVPLARLEPTPFTERLVAKFGLPVQGWTVDRSSEADHGHDADAHRGSTWASRRRDHLARARWSRRHRRALSSSWVQG